VEIRIPAVGAEQEKILPLQGLAGGKPTDVFPWYFNLSRQRLYGDQIELTAFWTTGKEECSGEICQLWRAKGNRGKPSLRLLD